MNEHKKPIREIDKDYLAYIRKQLCLITEQEAEPHHTKSRGAGGSDYLAVPLSRKKHTECEMIGKNTFQYKHYISFDKEIIRLLIGYIKKLKQ